MEQRKVHVEGRHFPIRFDRYVRPWGLALTLEACFACSSQLRPSLTHCGDTQISIVRSGEHQAPGKQLQLWRLIIRYVFNSVARKNPGMRRFSPLVKVFLPSGTYQLVAHQRQEIEHLQQELARIQEIDDQEFGRCVVADACMHVHLCTLLYIDIKACCKFSYQSVGIHIYACGHYYGKHKIAPSRNART